ncbi:MAG: NUDIX hydrolase [Chloroflexota bacterium]
MRLPEGIKTPATMCILQSSHGLLLLRRTYPPHVGLFSPIGGKIDPHEQPEAAARREVQEEAGVTLNSMTLAGILTETSPTSYNWISYIYTAHVDPFDPPACAEGELRWIAPDAVNDVPTPPTDYAIYTYVLRGQFFVFDALFDSEQTLRHMRDEITGRLVYPASR